MKAYCIVYEYIDDPQMFEQYRRQVMPTIEAFGGRFVVRGGKFTVLEGDMPANASQCWSFPHGRRPRIGTTPPLTRRSCPCG